MMSSKMSATMKTQFQAGVLGLFIMIGTSSALAADGAGLFVEPGLTYERGKTRTDWPLVSNDSTGESNGLGVMGRVGFHVQDILFVGLDGRYSMPTFKDSSVNYSADATQFNWGPLVGIQTPILGLRVWGSYVAGGFLDPKASGSFDVKLESPTGYRVGVGWGLLVLSVNLEYQSLKYDKLNVENAGGFTFGSFDSVKPKNESLILSVSFPVNI